MNSQNFGLNKILDLSKKLDIYNEIPELLSCQALETTLLNFQLRFFCK